MTRHSVKLTKSPVLSSGVNNLNFLLSGGQTPAGVVLPTSSSGPTLALPYVLVPSALSHYPLVPSSLQQQVADAHSNLSFSVPAMMSATHFVMGTSPYSMAASEITSGPPTPLPSTPEQSSLCGSRSPSGPRQTVSISTPEPLVRTDYCIFIFSLRFTPSGGVCVSRGLVHE